MDALKEAKILFEKGIRLSNEMTEKMVTLARKSVSHEFNKEEHKRLEAEIDALKKEIDDTYKRVKELRQK